MADVKLQAAAADPSHPELGQCRQLWMNDVQAICQIMPEAMRNRILNFGRQRGAKVVQVPISGVVRIIW
jgi:hypothetical protein